MNTDFASGYFLGLASGIGLTNAWRLYGHLIRAFINGGQPIRLARVVSTVAFSTNAAPIEPVHIIPMWQTHTRAFILWGERCTRPFLISEMKWHTGLSYPEIKSYLNVLADGGVIRVTPRAPTKFLMGYADRRRATLSLPYPKGIEPPRFVLRKS